MSAFEGAYAKALQLGAPRGHFFCAVGGTKFNFASTLQLVFFLGVSFGKMFWDHCALLLWSRFNPESPVFLLQVFPLHCVGGSVQLCTMKNPSDTKLSQMKSLKGWHLKIKVVF